LLLVVLGEEEASGSKDQRYGQSEFGETAHQGISLLGGMADLPLLGQAI
jgi:hypothetical protein